MNTLPMIDETFIQLTSQEVIHRRKNPAMALMIALVGSALTIWSLSGSLKTEHADLSSTLMMAGGLIALAGFIMTGINLRSSFPVYKPSGERIYRYQWYYKSSDKPALCAAVNACDTQKLSKIARTSQTSGLLLTLYATKSGAFAMAQVSQYVPHAFEPITPVMRFEAAAELMMAKPV